VTNTYSSLQIDCSSCNNEHISKHLLLQEHVGIQFERIYCTAKPLPVSKRLLLHAVPILASSFLCRRIVVFGYLLDLIPF